MKGFTLIELIIVIAVAAALSAVGIAAFVNYSRAQVLSAAVLDIESMLILAKSRAQSQVKPQACEPLLSGYRVDFLADNKTYKLIAVCGNNTNDIPGQSRTLPGLLQFDSTVLLGGVLFKVITGEAVLDGEGQIEIRNSQDVCQKRISISRAGSIVVLGC